MNKVVCSVCQHKINQNFCSNCGQKFVNQKVRLSTIITDFFDNLFSAEKSFVFNFVLFTLLFLVTLLSLGAKIEF